VLIADCYKLRILLLNSELVNYYFNASSVTQTFQSSCAANTIRLCYDELRSQLYVIPSVVIRPKRVVVSNTGRFTCILAVSLLCL